MQEISSSQEAQDRTVIIYTMWHVASLFPEGNYKIKRVLMSNSLSKLMTKVEMFKKRSKQNLYVDKDKFVFHSIIWKC